MAKLILVSGEEKQEFVLGPHNTLGRHPDNAVQILDRIISKEHCEILQGQDGRFLLRDLGSLNGTFIAGRRVQQHVLQDGDEITLGSTRLVFRDRLGEEHPIHRVTIAPGMLESHIRQRIAADPDTEFLPEKEISDEQILRRDYERLRIAHDLARAVGTELDQSTLLQKILDKAFEILLADRGVIMLMEEGGQLEMKATKQKLGSHSDEIVLSNSIINEVIKEKQAVLSSDATIDSRFSGAHSIIMQGIRSTMCVPLLHGDELLGIMNLDSQIATNAFSEKDLRIFTGIASQAAVSIKNAKLAQKNEWEARTRAQLQRFFSPGMVQQMVDGKLKIDDVGETREVTVLFADIRGFTAMTENADAGEIVQLLNEYFEVMVEVLFHYNGQLDKYVGDEIMALFGVPVARKDSTLLAVECALEMQHALSEFNRTRSSEHQPPLHVGIGINTGPVVYGAIGSSKTKQLTAIGDTVNTASRLCSLAQAGQIICSVQTMKKVKAQIDFEELPSQRVKGKHDELRLFRVTGSKGSFSQRDRTSPL